MQSVQVMQSMHVYRSGGCRGAQPPRNRNQQLEYQHAKHAGDAAKACANISGRCGGGAAPAIEINN